MRGLYVIAVDDGECLDASGFQFLRKAHHIGFGSAIEADLRAGI